MAKKDKDTPVGPKARNDAYVMMLFITLVAIITGSVLMYLDNEEYGKTAPPKDLVFSPPKLGEAPAPTPGAAPGGAGGAVPAPGGAGDAKGGDAKGGEVPKGDPKGMP
jgi:hypothetical protein